MRCTACPLDKIDRIPHGIPDAAGDAAGASTSSASTARRVILTFGLLSPDKGIEHVIDALPAILARHPETVYIVLGATHPHVKEHHGETYRLMLESARAPARRRRQHDLPQPLRQPGRARRVPRRRRHLHHAVPQARADHVGHAGVRRRLRQGGDLDAVLVRAASSSPTVAACSCRGAIRRRSRARSSRCSATTNGGSRSVERAAAYGRDMRWPAVARAYVDSFERAHGDHARRLRTGFQAQTLARRPLELPELDLGHLRAMTDDTGILQHAIFTVPRYDDGYCLDDNARALLLMTLVEDAGTRGRRGRPRACVALPGLREPRVPRARRTLPQLHVVRATLDRGVRLGGQPRPRAVGARHRRRPLAASGPAEPRRPPVPRRAAGDRGVHEPARVGVHAARHRRVPARVRRRHRASQAARKALAERLLDLLRALERARLAVVRGPLTYCNARLPQALIVVRRADAATRRCARRPALARLARRSSSSPTTALSRRSDRTASTGAASRARASISSRSKPARWSRRVSKRIG